MTNIRDVQTALQTLGYAVTVDGIMGPKTLATLQIFQSNRGLMADGLAGPKTMAALEAAVAARQALDGPKPASASVVPADWMPWARLERVIFHWTAGGYRASGLDRSHYHILIEADGKLVRGFPSIAANGIGSTGPRANHTLNCNTGSIGVSLCCMAGAVEQPFNGGRSPMTQAQWSMLANVIANLCRRYDIPVNPVHVLSHAEVQETLGIRQRGKWDVTRLPFDPVTRGAKAAGDLMRTMIASRL